jgi:hypothetical protein
MPFSVHHNVDSGHRCPHKDILIPSENGFSDGIIPDVEGKVLRKVWYDFLDNSQALTMAVTDIKDNHEFIKRGITNG